MNINGNPIRHFRNYDLSSRQLRLRLDMEMKDVRSAYTCYRDHYLTAIVIRQTCVRQQCVYVREGESEREWEIYHI